MMETFILKSGDSSPALIYRLDQDIDLTDATVTFSMATYPGAVPTIADAPAEIVSSAEPAEVQYRWPSQDSVLPGLYYGTFNAWWPGNARESFPNTGFIEIIIEESV